MGLSLLATTDTQIIRVVEALYKQTPGYTFLTNFRTYVTENSIGDLANALASSFSSQSDAEFAATVTANLGLTGDALTAGNAYLEAQFAANPGARGSVVLDAMNELATMENDPTFGAVAASFNSNTVASLTYSTVAANTAILAEGVGQTFTLTTSSDVGAIAGTTKADTYNATVIHAGTTDTLTSGDTIAASGGVDTLNVTASGDSGGASSLTGIASTGLEHVVFSNLDADATSATFDLDTAQMVGLESIIVNNSSATGETTFSNLGNFVDSGMNSNLGDVTLTYLAAVVAGTTDVQNLAVSGSSGTFTADGVETIAITSSTSAATLAAVDSDKMTKLTVAGDQNVTITAAVDFVNGTNDDTTIDGTVDASALTGNLTMTAEAMDMSLTGGTGDDTFNMLATLTAKDTIVGGDGTDTVTVSVSETAALASVTEVEAVEVETEDIGGGSTITIAGSAIASATTFIVDANTGTATDESTVAFTELDNGDTISIVQAGADSDSLADGVAVTGTVLTDTAADTLTLAFQGIGDVTANATNDTGVAAVTVDEIETLSIEANANAAGTVTTNGVESLSAQAATGITITGSADIDFDAFVNTTKLVSLDASAATGKLTLTGLDASKIVVKAGAKALTLDMAGLNNDDQIIGGASTTDAVSASAVTGLTSATGILNIQDVETVNLAATGANTIDTSLMTGVTTLAISGATPGTQTVTNVAASGLSVSAGIATAAFDNGAQLEIKLADETGDADALTVKIDNRAGTATDVALKTTAIETVTLDVLDLDTAANDAVVDMTTSKASTVNVTGGFAGQVITMTTLAVETTTVNLADFKGSVSFTAGATGSGMTVTAGASLADDDFTLSAKNDTITIAETGAVDVDVDGAGGTDTLNLSVKAGFIDTQNIDNVENINLAVRSGDDITIGANASEVDGIDDATKLVVTGGNSLSTLTIGGANDTLAGSTLLTVDASAFEGNTVLSYAADALLATMNISAGALTTDTVTALFDTTATDLKMAFTGVEVFNATVDSGGDGAETYSFDVSSATGLTSIELASGSHTAVGDLNIDEYTDSLTVQFGQAVGTGLGGSSTVDINLANTAGTTDTVNLKLQDTEDTGSIDVDAAGVEVLNIELTTDTESHSLDLGGVAATTNSNTKINVTGGVAGDGLTISAIASTVNEIDASALVGTLTLTGSNTTAMTVTGGTAADTIMMQHGSDVLNGGALTEGNTLDVNKAMVLGGIAVDLSSTTDQVTTFNGSANSAAQTGFYHVDVSGVTGSFGADITANAAGSTITGTANNDVVTGGAGVDTITGGDGDDTLSGGAGADVFVFASTGALNNADTISDFASADALDLTAFATDDSVLANEIADTATADADGAGGNTNITTNSIIKILDADGSVDTATEVAALFDDGTDAGQALTSLAANANVVMLIRDTGGDTTIWYVDGDGDATNGVAAGECTLVGTLTGYDTVFVDANIVD